MLVTILLAEILNTQPDGSTVSSIRTDRRGRIIGVLPKLNSLTVDRVTSSLM